MCDFDTWEGEGGTVKQETESDENEAHGLNK
jgi:hypothetical protein